MYAEIIEVRYPGIKPSIFDGDGGHFRFQNFGGIDGRGLEIVLWNSPDPQPTLAELDAYAASPEYLTAWGMKLKAEAIEQVNNWSDAIIISTGILIKQTFYGPMVANVAFRLLEWNREGRPTEPNPLHYITTYSEAQAYRDAHAGQGDAEETMSVVDLLELQKVRWTEMQTGFAGILYARRLVLEQIKLATVDATLPAALAVLVASLNSVLQQHVAGLQQMQQQILEQQ